MIIRTGDVRPASDDMVAREVSAVLERRSALAQPPVSLAISDAVALGIAALFASPTDSGRVMHRFHRSGAVDSHALVAAARFEQGYASAEGHAALFCLIGWARSREHAQAERAATA